MLLPVSATASSKTPSAETSVAASAFDPSLSFAHDHILLRPGTAALSTQRRSEVGEVMTLSGLRGTIEPVSPGAAPEPTQSSSDAEESSSADVDESHSHKKLVIRTFISRGDNAWMAQMWSSDGRRCVAALQSQR